LYFSMNRNKPNSPQAGRGRGGKRGTNGKPRSRGAVTRKKMEEKKASVRKASNEEIRKRREARQRREMERAMQMSTIIMSSTTGKVKVSKQRQPPRRGTDRKSTSNRAASRNNAIRNNAYYSPPARRKSVTAKAKEERDLRRALELSLRQTQAAKRRPLSEEELVAKALEDSKRENDRKIRQQLLADQDAAFAESLRIDSERKKIEEQNRMAGIGTDLHGTLWSPRRNEKKKKKNEDPLSFFEEIDYSFFTETDDTAQQPETKTNRDTDDAVDLDFLRKQWCEKFSSTRKEEKDTDNNKNKQKSLDSVPNKNNKNNKNDKNNRENEQIDVVSDSSFESTDHNNNNNRKNNSRLCVDRGVDDTNTTLSKNQNSNKKKFEDNKESKGLDDVNNNKNSNNKKNNNNVNNQGGSSWLASLVNSGFDPSFEHQTTPQDPLENNSVFTSHSNNEHNKNGYNEKSTKDYVNTDSQTNSHTLNEIGNKDCRKNDSPNHQDKSNKPKTDNDANCDTRQDGNNNWDASAEPEPSSWLTSLVKSGFDANLAPTAKEYKPENTCTTSATNHKVVNCRSTTVLVEDNACNQETEISEEERRRLLIRESWLKKFES